MTRVLIEEEGREDEWLERLPFVLGALRCMKMKVLGGHSPMEIVMGLQPQLPASLRAGIPVLMQDPDAYVTALLDYFKNAHQTVRDVQEELALDHEGKDMSTSGMDIDCLLYTSPSPRD